MDKNLKHAAPFDWIMKLFILPNEIKKIADMEKECKLGLMVQNTKAIERMVWLMAKED